MKLLLLYNLLPYPNVDHGGGKYVFNFIKYFKNKHDIYLYCTYLRKNRKNIEEIKKYVKNFKGFEIKQDNFSLFELFNLIGKYFYSKYPIYNNFINYPEMSHAIYNLLKKEKIDLIYCENTIIGHYLDKIPREFKGKIYLRDDELFYETIKRNFLIMVKNNIKDFINFRLDLYKIFQLFECFQYRKYKKYEQNLWKKVNFLSTSSDAEKDVILKNFPTKKVYTFYHGIDFINPNPPNAKVPIISFIGNYGHYPNVDAVLFFGKKIFPFIQEKIKGVKFYVVGREPPPSFLKMAKKNKSINILGFIDDIENIYKKTQVFVCPVRLGGGFRVKIIEALGYGIPVVSTTIGIEGLFKYNFNNNPILYASNIKGFASSVIKLLNNKDLRRETIKKGQNFAEFFLWDNIFKRIEFELFQKKK